MDRTDPKPLERLQPGPSPCADAARSRLERADAHLTDAERRAEFDVFNARLRQLVADGRLR